ncbi:MAG: hypothetical protein A2077_06240 [Nitrospirae bacterium GWC2_46_6]|nr:MAG: hypothetical protein A2077_06240 [Nitrospirae bacterium GWC2_46_6]OGW21329.1 MAG: hypothetical protein A2Z82_01325 [Nitrospirae bacterium GWA2_46_11]OGW26110.1 MAG: hypothetical protein A2X55_03565 [Nitrospirae bacterium GWB2_47_37]HAK89435.1 hypothetical protein [Nitrospiraceae bacterium]HCL81994.1 hypothetical protein [Nitrospiraceae bacterium]
MLKKVIIGLALILVLSIAGLILFFPLDSFVKEKIGAALGPDVSVGHLKIGWTAVVADDIGVKTPEGSDFLTVKKITIRPYFWSLLRKKLDIKEIEMDSPILALRKTKNGKWLLPVFKKKEDKKQAVEFIVKTIKVNNGTILFKDDIKGFNIDLTNVRIEAKSSQSILRPGKTAIDASAKLPNNGSAAIKSEGNIFDAAFTGNLSIKDMDMTLLKPYMKGDVKVKKGRLNLDSNFSVDRGYVKAPSVLKIRNMDIETKGVLMGVSAPLVIDLIKKKDTVEVGFHVWGKWNNLQNNLKEAFKKKVFDELGRAITSPVEDVLTGIGGLLPAIK